MRGLKRAAWAVVVLLAWGSGPVAEAQRSPGEELETGSEEEPEDGDAEDAEGGPEEGEAEDGPDAEDAFPTTLTDELAAQEAESLVDAGHAAFEGGRFEAALAHYETAFELTGEPALLLRVAAAADALRRDRIALQAYESYLRSDADPDLVPELEARVRVLRRATDRRMAAMLDWPPPPSEPEVDAGSAEPAGSGPSDGSEDGDHWWIYATTGAAVGALVVVIAVLASQEGGEITSPSRGMLGIDF